MTVLLACCTLIAATDTETRASVTSSMRAGQLASLTDAASEPGVEAVIEPGIELELTERNRQTRLRLGGRFSTLQLESQEQSFASGVFLLSHDHPLNRTLDLNATAQASGGTQDFRQTLVTLGSDPDAPPSQLPTAGNATQLDSFLVRFINARAALGVTKRWDPRRSLRVSVATLYGDGEGDGNAEHSGAGQFPRQRTLSLETTYTHRLTRRDQLTTALELSQSELEIVGLYRLARLNVDWTRRLRLGDLGVQLGGLFVQTELEDGVQLIPNATLRGSTELWSQGDRRLRGGIETGLLTTFDQFSARLLPRANVALVVTASFGNEWQWTSTGSFQAPVGNGIGGVDTLPIDTFIAAQSRAEWRIDEEVALTGGLTWFMRAAPLDEPFDVRQQEFAATLGLNVGYAL